MMVPHEQAMPVTCASLLKAGLLFLLPNKMSGSASVGEGKEPDFRDRPSSGEQDLASAKKASSCRSFAYPTTLIFFGGFVSVRRPIGTSSIVLGAPSSPVTTYSG